MRQTQEWLSGAILGILALLHPSSAGAEKRDGTTTPQLQHGLSCAVAEPLTHTVHKPNMTPSHSAETNRRSRDTAPSVTGWSCKHENLSLIP